MNYIFFKLFVMQRKKIGHLYYLYMYIHQNLIAVYVFFYKHAHVHVLEKNCNYSIQKH